MSATPDRKYFVPSVLAPYSASLVPHNGRWRVAIKTRYTTAIADPADALRLLQALTRVLRVEREGGE